MEYNEEVLEYLRNNTVLNPIDYSKILIARKNDEKNREWKDNIEHEISEVDYSNSDILEFEIRLRAWENSCFKLWNQYNDGLDLEEFSLNILNQRINEERANKR